MTVTFQLGKWPDGEVYTTVFVDGKVAGTIWLEERKSSFEREYGYESDITGMSWATNKFGDAVQHLVDVYEEEQARLTRSP